MTVPEFSGIGDSLRFRRKFTKRFVVLIDAVLGHLRSRSVGNADGSRYDRLTEQQQQQGCAYFSPHNFLNHTPLTVYLLDARGGRMFL
jgi:hypothetical protein